jgi:hypothetical protein
MRLPKKITGAWLRKNHACEAAVEVFETEWPKGAEITPANIRRALALYLDLWWFLARILSSEEYQEYDRRWRAAEKRARKKYPRAGADRDAYFSAADKRLTISVLRAKEPPR